ncbi:MAG: adenosylcobinamide-GDP ribazoletransferase [Pseudomonadota bacterium]
MIASLLALGTTLTFFSRLPVPSAFSQGRLVDDVWTVPLAGAIIALPSAAILVIADALGASHLIAAVLAVALAIIITGALHEDGLADCADGFWGGRDVERRLTIMRDSRIGTYGVLALIIAVLLKVAIIEMAVQAGAWRAAGIVIASAAATRAVALFPWVGLPPARADGLAASIGRPTLSVFRRAILLALLTTILVVGWWAPIGAALACGACAVAAKACASLAERKIGGHTGDVIGATVVVADLSYALIITIWVV